MHMTDQLRVSAFTFTLLMYLFTEFLLEFLKKNSNIAACLFYLFLVNQNRQQGYYAVPCLICGYL